MSKVMTIVERVLVRNSVHAITITATAESVNVNIIDEGSAVNSTATVADVDLTWEQAADVEHLSSAFELETVRVFRVLVTCLGSLSRSNIKETLE